MAYNAKINMGDQMPEDMPEKMSSSEMAPITVTPKPPVAPFFGDAKNHGQAVSALAKTGAGGKAVSALARKKTP